MGCHGLPAIPAVSNLIHDFEQASGQQINRGKSALIPARQLSDDERASCLAIWNSDIRMSSRERVLGVCSSVSMCPFTINTTMQFTSLIWHFLSLVSKRLYPLPMRVLVDTFLVPKSTIFHAACVAARDRAESLRFLTPHMGQTRNVHCMENSYSFKIFDFPMSLVCLLSTREAATTTHFFPALRSTSLHIQKSCRRLAIVVFNVFFVACINGWLMQNSIVRRLTWNIGCKPKDGVVTHCVVHCDTNPGVSRNLTDGSC